MTQLERCELAKAKGYTYDSITGEIRGVRGKVIKRESKGYICCCVLYEGINYKIYGHRLAWYLHYGQLPKNFIDHIDGCRNNNKISNLRDVTQHQNSYNRATAKGYTWNKRNKKFEAAIYINNKRKSLGLFGNEQDAHTAYLEAKKKYSIL